MIKLLNSETGERSIALGLALGMFIGFAPFFSLQTILAFIVLFVFKIQFGAALCAAFFFSLVAFLLDPLFNIVGIFFLELSFLRSVYETLYALPIIPFTRFYNSIAMGSLVLSFVLLYPVYFLFLKLIHRYRISVVEKYKSSKFFKALKTTTIYKWYSKYNEFYGQ